MAVGSTLSAHTKAEALRLAVDSAMSRGGGSSETMSSGSCPSLEYLEPFAVPVAVHGQEEVIFHYRRDPPLEGQEHPGGWTFGSDGTSRVLQGCLFATLEQKQLLSLLTQWSQRLTAMQRQSLRHVYIAQPRNGPESWDAHLSVVVLMEKDTQTWGEQSPLCGPSHPDAVLSTPEQQLVEAVMKAAPLLKRMDVFTAFTDGHIHQLYPKVHRSGSVGPYSDVFWSSGTAQRILSCVCGPLGAAVSVTLPAWHSHVHYALFGSPGAAPTASCNVWSDNWGVRNTLSLWRHQNALAATCSVALSLLWDGVDPTSVAVGMYARESGGITPSNPLPSNPAIAEGTAAALTLRTALEAALAVVSRPLMGVRLLPSYCTASPTAEWPSLSAATSVVLLVAVVTDGAVDGQQMCAMLAAADASGCSTVRLLLMQCDGSTRLDVLQTVMQVVKDWSDHYRPSRGVTAPRLSTVRSGVVDVDNLSAAGVGYSLLCFSFPH